MLRIEIAKRANGSGVLRCTRSDGSCVWQKQNSRHALHFALHDLTHFAIESTLGFENGFLGLIDGGWDIEDTEGKGARGPLPDEAAEVEYLSGCFDMERASGSIWTAEEFNDHARIYARATGRDEPRLLSDDDLARVRVRRAELFAQWFALNPGASIELAFTRLSGQSSPHRSAPAPARSRR